MTTTTFETNGFGFEEGLPLCAVQNSLECIGRIQERVSRQTAVLQEILQRFSGTGRDTRLPERFSGGSEPSTIQEKRRFLPIVEWLKQQLLQEQLKRATTARMQELFQRAANEAAVLAFSTDYPLLVLPGLMQERFREAGRASG